SVCTPGGSAPLANRVSHSQPISEVPRLVAVLAGWLATAVCRHTRLWPSLADTRSGKEVGESPVYIEPWSAFSGWLGRDGSRHMVVGPPGPGSFGAPWIVLYSISRRWLESGS